MKLRAGEPEEIAAYLKMDVFDFTRDFCRITPDRAALSLTEKEDGSCIFLMPDSRCAVNPVKPAQCRDFPEKWNFPGWEKLCRGAENFPGEEAGDGKRLEKQTEDGKIEF